MTQNDYLPYKAINVFIESKFLRETLELILKNFETLPKEDQISFVKSFREYVTILGFRNPMRAPITLQVNAYIKAFEDKDEVIPFTLSTWAKIKSDFASVVESWLESEGWDQLSTEKHFDENEGFLNKWPEGLSFEKIIEDFKKAHPKFDFDEDDLILMVLWISGRLPQEDSGL